MFCVVTKPQLAFNNYAAQTMCPIYWIVFCKRIIMNKDIKVYYTRQYNLWQGKKDIIGVNK